MRRRANGGYVTAETAVALPALILVLWALLWGLAAMTAQLRCVDAARTAARAAARGETPQASRAAAAAAAPHGAVIDISTSGGLVRVDVSSAVRSPGPLLSSLGAFRVAGHASADVEQADGP